MTDQESSIAPQIHRLFLFLLFSDPSFCTFEKTSTRPFLFLFFFFRSYFLFLHLFPNHASPFFFRTLFLSLSLFNFSSPLWRTMSDRYLHQRDSSNAAPHREDKETRMKTAFDFKQQKKNTACFYSAHLFLLAWNSSPTFGNDFVTLFVMWAFPHHRGVPRRSLCSPKVYSLKIIQLRVFSRGIISFLCVCSSCCIVFTLSEIGSAYLHFVVIVWLTRWTKYTFLLDHSLKFDKLGVLVARERERCVWIVFNQTCAGAIRNGSITNWAYWLILLGRWRD